MSSNRGVLPLRQAYPFGEGKGFSKEIEEIRTMPIEWDLDYSSSVRRGYLVALFKEKAVWDEFVQTHWPAAESDWGRSKLKFWHELMQRYKDFLCNPGENNAQDTDPEKEVQIFALEAHLRDFLAKNPATVEPGLTLFEKEGRRGIEYQVDDGDGRIDLLLVDSKGGLVVVELKVSRGRNKTLGQILYYMGWVDEHLSSKPCRGIIIANEITGDLKIAVKRVPGISLMKYNLNVSLEKV